MLVDVDLDHPDLAAVRQHDLLQNWRQLLAGAAPGRPEIDNDRNLARRLDDILGECRRPGVLDDIAWRAHGCSRVACSNVHSNVSLTLCRSDAKSGCEKTALAGGADQLAHMIARKRKNRDGHHRRFAAGQQFPDVVTR